MKLKLIFFLSLIALFSCSTPPVNNDEQIKIVCTTGIIGDMVANIVGEAAEVKSMMGPGVDPHLYKASQGDLRLLTNADIIIHNGLHLEGKMGEIFNKLKNRKIIFTAADGLQEKDLINNSNFLGAYDPHIWFDLNLWYKACLHLTESLANVEGLPKEKIMAQGQKYAAQIKEMSAWVKNEIHKIPEKQRVLITAHDAFSYFGKAYDIEVKGLQGISTASEYGLKDVSDLVNFIIERDIRAVYIESSVSDKALQAVIKGCESKGHNAVIGGMLYSDALGENGSPEGTYLGVVRHNVNAIVEGLIKGETNEK